MCKILGHPSSITGHSDGWTNRFVPFFLCKLSGNHSVRQDRHKKCVECVQTGGFVTLSGIRLSGKYLRDMGDIVQC